MLAVLVAVLLLAYATAALADLVFKGKAVDGSDMALTLHEAKCENPAVLRWIIESYHHEFRASTLLYQGEKYASCWAVQGQHVYSIDEKGDQLRPIPAGAFAPVLNG